MSKSNIVNLTMSNKPDTPNKQSNKQLAHKTCHQKIKHAHKTCHQKIKHMNEIKYTIFYQKQQNSNHLLLNIKFI